MCAVNQSAALRGGRPSQLPVLARDNRMPTELQVFDAIAARLCPAATGSGLHGVLTGVLCVDGAGPDAADAAARALAIDAAAVTLDALRAALAQVEARLLDAELAFTPLLPDDDAPLSARVTRLAQWCEAFVDGYSTRDEKRGPVSADASELLLDISAIAGELQPESLGQGEEDDERDYAEIVEFLRVAALNLFGERASHGDARKH